MKTIPPYITKFGLEISYEELVQEAKEQKFIDEHPIECKTDPNKLVEIIGCNGESYGIGETYIFNDAEIAGGSEQIIGKDQLFIIGDVVGIKSSYGTMAEFNEMKRNGKFTKLLFYREITK